MNSGREPGSNKQTMFFIFIIKTRHKSVSCDNSKITRNEMSKWFSYDFDQYDIVKFRWYVNFEEIDTEPSTGKNDGFWLLWVIFKEYIKQNIIMALLKKQALI